MTNLRFIRTAAVATAMAGMVAGAYAQSQKFPSRPLRAVVSIAPGGGMDMISRAMAQKLGETLGQTVVVDNRPGAGGNIAMEIAAGSAPDGHNLLIISATSVIFPVLYKARFDVLRDFAPVSQISAQGYVLVVIPSMPARSVTELVQHLKANPGKINFSSSGIGSPNHLTAELFSAMSGTRMTHVPYKGSAPAFADMLAGQIDLAFPAIMSSQPLIRSGKLRALAVTTPKRSFVVPELPTIVEAGVPGVVVVNWYGLLAPLNTPAWIVDRLSRGVAASMNSPEVVKRLQNDGSDAATSTPEEFRKHITEERDKWTRVIRNANIRVQ
jgi:tripartite-type tricarboxylate transporter receptor subunit TctC